MKGRQILLLIMGQVLAIFYLSACNPSQEEIDAISSQAAAEIFSNQTAEAPKSTQTPTSTRTPTPTLTLTPTPTLAQTLTPTAVPVPSSFSDYHSAEVSAKIIIDPILFSVTYPTDWVTGWTMDSGVTAFSMMSDPDAWTHPSGVWLMIIPGVSSEDFPALLNEFTRGMIIEGPGETVVNGHKLVQVASSDGEILQIAAFIEGGNPTEGVFVVALMPLSGEELYRPLMEQIIHSIEVYSKIENAVITADPASGPIPTIYNFTLSEFQTNETVHITIYYEPPPQWINLLYETTLTIDENGFGEFSLTSAESNFKGEYLVRAMGYAGSYAEVLVTFGTP